MNLAQLRQEREKAGAAYVEALATFRDAWVRLAAIDRTMQNQNVAGESGPTFHRNRLKMDEALKSFQHMAFIPRIDVNDWHDRVTTVSDRQIEEFRR